MNKRIKRLWIKALRSGGYEQGRGMLRLNNAFCCLGVLCDLRAKETGTQWKAFRHSRAFSYASGHMVLPRAVRKWAGLDDADPRVGQRRPVRLSELNDSGKSFKYIADRIEKYL